MSTLGNFTGSIPEQPLGIYKPHRYGEVTPPFMILRQLATDPPQLHRLFSNYREGGRR